MSKKLGVSFIVTADHPAKDQILEHETDRSAYGLGREIVKHFKPVQIPPMVDGHDAYMLQVVVLTPDEYHKLKETEWMYKELQK